MKQKYIIAASFYIILLCLASVVSADVGGNNHIIINVRTLTTGPFIADNSVIESPVEAAVICIYEDNQLIYNDTTDEQGKIEVDLETGVYLFTVEAQGFEFKETIESITESTVVTLFLTPSASLLHYIAIIAIIIIITIFIFVEYKNNKRKKKNHGKKKPL